MERFGRISLIRHLLLFLSTQTRHSANLLTNLDKIYSRLCVCCDGEPASEGDQKNLPWVHASYPFRHDVLFGTIDKLVKFHDDPDEHGD